MQMNILTVISQLLFGICLLLILGCDDKSDNDIDKELCEAQGGTPVVFYVENRDTGEIGLEVRCEFQKEDHDIYFCKPDNGRGQECR